MADRSERRYRTELVVKRRLRGHRSINASWTPDNAHELHKHDPMGHCSNRRCAICLLEKAEKRLTKKRERVAGHQEETRED